MICRQPAAAKLRLKLPKTKHWRAAFIGIQPGFEMAFGNCVFL